MSDVSIASSVSKASSVISDYLGGKIEALAAERDGLLAYRVELKKARETLALGDEEFEAELNTIRKDLYPICVALNDYDGHKRFIEQDIRQDIEEEACDRGQEPDIGFYERAYANTLLHRVMGASSKQGKCGFSRNEQAEFRQSVLECYGALKQYPGEDKAWCHVTGYWWPKELVKAAHLVPKLLTGNELAFLFGVKELILHDPKNGLSLHGKIELALDSGKISIVPLPTTDYASCKWKCVLVDQSVLNQVACSYGSESILWKVGVSLSFISKTRAYLTLMQDLDGKELQFLTANRPARRYLYFRFLITYLHAKQSGHSAFTSTVDSRHTFWASPGPYLEKSTLRSLARNISGLELPPSITEHTFDASASASATENAAIIVSTELQDAVEASSKRWDDKDETDEDTEDEDPDYN